MGDAIHDNVASLAAAHTEMVAGYVTGSSSVLWTAADWARFPGIPHVTIDQGFTGSPVPTAVVRDVEAGAWTVGAAVDKTGWTAPRPTIYCSLDTVPSIVSAGWRGDTWVALYDGIPALNFAVPAGINVVGKQYTDQGGGGTYDLSAVFDPYWPDKQTTEDTVQLPGIPGTWLSAPDVYYEEASNTKIVVGYGVNGAVYMTRSVGGGQFTAPVALRTIPV